MSSNLASELKGFGLPEALPVEKVLATALRRGGSLAELFFEDTESSRVFYEGGRIDRVMDGRDRGAGLRVIFDGRQVYGYTTDLTEDSLLALAETLSEAVSGTSRASTPAIEWRRPRQPTAE